MLHAPEGRGEEERLGIDVKSLAVDCFHAAAGEMNQPLSLPVICASGIEHHRLLALHGSNQGLGVFQLAGGGTPATGCFVTGGRTPWPLTGKGNGPAEIDTTV